MSSPSFLFLCVYKCCVETGYSIPVNLHGFLTWYLFLKGNEGGDNWPYRKHSTWSMIHQRCCPKMACFLTTFYKAHLLKLYFYLPFWKSLEQADLFSPRRKDRKRASRMAEPSNENGPILTPCVPLNFNLSWRFLVSTLLGATKKVD